MRTLRNDDGVVFCAIRRLEQFNAGIDNFAVGGIELRLAKFPYGRGRSIRGCITVTCNIPLFAQLFQRRLHLRAAVCRTLKQGQNEFLGGIGHTARTI